MTGRTLSPEQEARRIAAYHATASDSEAARSLGMEQGNFWRWRQSRGLLAKGSDRRITEDVQVKRRAAYAANPSDLSAARMLGIARGTFAHWRIDNGLPAKNPPHAIGSLTIKAGKGTRAKMRVLLTRIEVDVLEILEQRKGKRTSHSPTMLLTRIQDNLAQLRLGIEATLIEEPGERE